MTEAAIATPFNRDTRKRSAAGRRTRSMLGWIFCTICFLMVAVPLADIILLVFVRGISALSPSLFTEVTQGVGGGLLNAITGTLVLSVGALVIGVPIGVGAGIYLSEFGNGRFGSITSPM